MKNYCLLLFLLLNWLSNSVFAYPFKEPVAVLTNSILYINHPDKALRKEIHDAMKALWENADSNKDNQITKQEAKLANMVLCLNYFEAIDTDRNGKISESESKLWMKSYTETRLKQSKEFKELESIEDTEDLNFVNTVENHKLETLHNDKLHIKKPYRSMEFKSPEQRQKELLSKISEKINQTNKNHFKPNPQTIHFIQ